MWYSYTNNFSSTAIHILPVTPCATGLFFCSLRHLCHWASKTKLSLPNQHLPPFFPRRKWLKFYWALYNKCFTKVPCGANWLILKISSFDANKIIQESLPAMVSVTCSCIYRKFRPWQKQQITKDKTSHANQIKWLLHFFSSEKDCFSTFSLGLQCTWTLLNSAQSII